MRMRESQNTQSPRLHFHQEGVEIEHGTILWREFGASAYDLGFFSVVRNYASDILDAHYSALERMRPHASMGGWVFVGYIDEYGEEREDAYPCRRCASEAGR